MTADQIGSITIDTRIAEQMARDAPAWSLRALKKIGFDWVAYAQTHMTVSVSSPGGPPGVDFGNLKNAINSYQSGAMEVTVEDGVPYGVHLEFGTRFMAARPWFMAALNAVYETIPDAFRATITGEE